MFKIEKLLSKENRTLIFRYILISILSYGFVFSGLIALVSFFKINKTYAFLIIYGINYIFLYIVQLRFLFKTNHTKYKLIRFISFIIFFYLLANLIYNIGLYFQINYLISTGLTVIILMPLRIIISKLFVYKD